MLFDFDFKPQVFEIKETVTDGTKVSFVCSHISNNLESDIMLSSTVGMSSANIGTHIFNALGNSTGSTWEIGDVMGYFDSDTRLLDFTNFSNSFNNDLESGNISSSTGANTVDATYTRTKDYVDVTQLKNYLYYNKTATNQAYLFYYTDDDVFIARQSLGSTGTSYFQMPSGARKARLSINNTSLTQDIIFSNDSFQFKTVKEFLDIVASTFDCYYKYRVVINEATNIGSNFITKFYVDVYSNLGNSDTGAIYAEGSNIGTVNISERNEGVYTAVIPLSSSLAYSTWYAYGRTDAPYYKASNSHYMYNLDTYNRYSKRGIIREHNVSTQSFDDATNALELFNRGKDYLAHNNIPKRNYDLKTVEELDSLLKYPKVGDSTNVLSLNANRKEWKDITEIRYIRNSTNGNSVNSTNVFNEIRVYESDGNNLAYGKTVTAQEFSGGTWNNVVTPALTSPAGGTFGIITDNNPVTWCIPTFNATPQRITVDLGATYNVAEIVMNHYYADGRAYMFNTLEVSADGSTWYTIFDSETQGRYAETVLGRTVEVPYDLIKNDSGFVYGNDIISLGIVEVSYSLNYPKEVNITFGEIQKDITDRI
jgi:hypothetical protein